MNNENDGEWTCFLSKIIMYRTHPWDSTKEQLSKLICHLIYRWFAIQPYIFLCFLLQTLIPNLQLTVIKFSQWTIWFAHQNVKLVVCHTTWICFLNYWLGQYRLLQFGCIRSDFPRRIIEETITALERCVLKFFFQSHSVVWMAARAN